jgi:hypothetical protein
MSVVAVLRPASFEDPLFLHVLGASLLVGSLLLALAAQVLAWRRNWTDDGTFYNRLSFRTLLWVAIPSWFLMRGGAQWIYSKEGFSGDNYPSWIGIGYVTADIGGIVLLAAAILAGFGVRRQARKSGESSVWTRFAGILVMVLIVAYLVALWAMTTKPG